jgi:phosphohistidine phosphatase SixA
MITILLIRHGIAEDSKGPDADRALTAEGWEKTRAAMKGLVARGYIPTVGVSSPYRRAAETLICLREATQDGFSVGYWDGLRPGGAMNPAELWLRAQVAEGRPSEVIALVSHQPFLGSFVRHLTGNSLDIKKASCSVIHWTGSRFDYAGYFSPSQLRGD